MLLCCGLGVQDLKDMIRHVAKDTDIESIVKDFNVEDRVKVSEFLLTL
jgi:hypothetical protein